MRLIKQFLLVLALLFVSRVVVVLLGIPIPPTIMAMILLLILLEVRLLKPEWFDEVSKPLLTHITLFLMPPSLAFAGAIGKLSGWWVQLLLISMVSATVIFVVTAKTIEWMMGKERVDATGDHVKN